MNDRTLAREWSRNHASMLRAERAVLAELLLSLAEFESRALHRDLGYATFFDYLHRELGLSRGMSHGRQVTVRSSTAPARRRGRSPSRSRRGRWLPGGPS